MISRLRGSAVGHWPEGLVLDVGGVGYLLAATPSALRKAEGGREVSIETYLHVREDALQLYGFGEAAERELFVHLLGVSGIGPKVALGVVSSGSVDDLRRAIAVGDPARFQAIPGIGKKTAERIVLELKDKLGVVAAWEAASAEHAPTPEQSQANEAVLALIALGYKQVDAHKTVRELQEREPGIKTAEELVKMALKKMAAGR
jgi:holliday junction DNA helicase RuvA